MSMRWKHDYIIKQIDVLKLLRSDADYLLAFPHQRALGAVLAADNVAMTVPDTHDLVINGDFVNWTGDNPDDWSVIGEVGADPEVSEVGSGESHGGVGTGACNLFNSATASNPQIRQTSLSVGKPFEITVVISAISGTLRIQDNAGGFVQDYTTTGTKVFSGTAANATLRVLALTAGANITIDSITAKQTGILDSGDYPGAELYVTANAASDPAGNEANATTGWAATATLTSDSSIKADGSYSLKAVFAGAQTAYFDLDTILTTGKTYRLEVKARHLGSGGVCGVHLAAGTGGVDNLIVSLDNTDTTFINYPIQFIHSATTRYLNTRELSATDDGGVYLDNISITEANPLNGDDTGTEPGVPMGSYYSKTDDGATSFSALGLTEYNSMIDLELFHIGIGIQKAVWDTTERYFISHVIDADNWIKIGGTTTAGQLVYEIRAGGVTEQVLYASGSPTGIIMPSISSKGGVMKAWLGRTQVGGDVSIANTLAGNFASMTIGAENGTPQKVNLANRNWYWHMSDEKTTAELERIAKGIGAAL